MIFFQDMYTSENCGLKCNDCNTTVVTVVDTNEDEVSVVCNHCGREYIIPDSIFDIVFKPYDTGKCVKVEVVNISRQKCVCDMRNLMIGGCKCGGV